MNPAVKKILTFFNDIPEFSNHDRNVYLIEKPNIPHIELMANLRIRNYIDKKNGRNFHFEINPSSKKKFHFFFKIEGFPKNQ